MYTFQYSVTFSNNYLCRGAVDNQNDMHHDGEKKHQVGLENVWVKHRWSIRLFVFLIACTGLNSYLCINYFLKMDEKFKVLRLILVYIHIHNELLYIRSDKDKLEGLRKWKFPSFGDITFPCKEMEGYKMIL